MVRRLRVDSNKDASFFLKHIDLPDEADHQPERISQAEEEQISQLIERSKLTLSPME